METSEYLQVLDYGIGGHFVPHCDFSDDAGFFNNNGNLKKGKNKILNRRESFNLILRKN